MQMQSFLGEVANRRTYSTLHLESPLSDGKPEYSAGEFQETDIMQTSRSVVPLSLPVLICLFAIFCSREGRVLAIKRVTRVVCRSILPYSPRLRSHLCYHLPTSSNSDRTLDTLAFGKTTQRLLNDVRRGTNPVHQPSRENSKPPSSSRKLWSTRVSTWNVFDRVM